MIMTKVTAVVALFCVAAVVAAAAEESKCNRPDLSLDKPEEINKFIETLSDDEILECGRKFGDEYFDAFTDSSVDLGAFYKRAKASSANIQDAMSALHAGNPHTDGYKFRYVIDGMKKAAAKVRGYMWLKQTVERVEAPEVESVLNSIAVSEQLSKENLSAHLLQQHDLKKDPKSLLRLPEKQLNMWQNYELKYQHARESVVDLLEEQMATPEVQADAKRRKESKKQTFKRLHDELLGACRRLERDLKKSPLKFMVFNRHYTPDVEGDAKLIFELWIQCPAAYLVDEDTYLKTWKARHPEESTLNRLLRKI